MCNEVLYFFECGHQAIERMVDYCCYVLNSFDRMELLNYSEADPRITENDLKCGESFKTVLRTTASMCQECQLTSSFKVPATETNMRLSLIDEASWLGDNATKPPQTFILDDHHTPSDWSLEMKGTPFTSEAHTNCSLYASDSGPPKDQTKFFWICENETIGALYTAIKAPPERSSVSSKQNRLIWIDEDPTLTPSSPGLETSRTAPFDNLIETSSFSFQREPSYFLKPLSWAAGASFTKAESASATEEARLPFLLEHMEAVPRYSGHPICMPSARASAVHEGILSSRDTAVTKVAKRRQFAGQQQTRWRVADVVVAP